MKKLRITVEGRSYDVTVEVLEDDEHPEPHPNGLNTNHHAPANVPNGAVPSPPALAHHQPTESVPSVIKAPIAGTVQKIFVQVGGRVEAKAPLLMLDAMKMDTYIYAPIAATIRDVLVESGAAVQVGQPLISFEAEA